MRAREPNVLLGTYLCLSLAPHLLGLTLLARRSPPLVRTLLHSTLLLGALLLASQGFSIWAQLRASGEGMSWGATASYLAAGSMGWLILALPILGLLSPLWTAAWLRRR